MKAEIFIELRKSKIKRAAIIRKLLVQGNSMVLE
jgi:hypothetical protein